jgi:hypothetical protein
MQVLASSGPSRPQTRSAPSALPCRPIAIRATPPFTYSQPRSGRFFCLAVFAALVALCLYLLAGAALEAQTTHFGAVGAVGSGLTTPTTVALLDGNANANAGIAGPSM